MLLTTQEISLGKIHVEDGKLSTQNNCTFVIASNCIENKDFVQGALSSLRERGGYLVSRENLDFNIKQALADLPAGVQLITVIPTDDEMIVLLQRANKRSIFGTVVNISNDPYAAESYEWLEQLKVATRDSASVIVLSQNNPYSGIVGLVNCIRKEPEGTKVTCVFIDDMTAPAFDVDNPFYKDQLKLGLAINVYKNVSLLKKNIIRSVE